MSAVTTVAIDYRTVTDPFFVIDKTRLNRFILHWLRALDKRSAKYTPYPEDDNEETLRFALRSMWLIEGEPGRYYLTGPHRNGAWLFRDSKPEVSTYVVEAVGAGQAKIGRSRDVTARLANLQCANSNPLRLIAVIKGDCEQELHRMFAADRISGEWFNLTEHLRETVMDMAVRL